MNNIIKKKRVDFYNMDEIKRYIYKVQSSANEKGLSYICKINGNYIYIDDNQLEENKNYYFDIFKTIMLGNLASACYYDQEEEIEKLSTLLLNFGDIEEGKGFKKLVKNILRKENGEKSIMFSPISQYLPTMQAIALSQQISNDEKKYVYYNYDGFDFVHLPYESLKEYDVMPAYENVKKANRLNAFIKTLDKAENFEEDSFDNE